MNCTRFGSWRASWAAISSRSVPDFSHALHYRLSVSPSQSPDPIAPYSFQLEEVGKGTFNTVYRARHTRFCQDVALRLVKRKDLDEEGGLAKGVQDELIVMKRVSGHKNVVSLMDIVVTRDFLVVVMEYADGGTLLDMLHSYGGIFDESTALHVFQQIVFGLRWIHEKKVSHRDIKLENIVIVSGNGENPVVKLCDFGFAKCAELTSEPKTMLGTHGMSAPEVYSRHGGVNTYYNGEKADAWSCGVVLYTMLCGQLPFGPKIVGEKFTNAELTRSVAQYVEDMNALNFVVPIETLLHKGIHKGCIDLLRKIFVISPVDRVGFEGIIEHPWFKRMTSPAYEMMTDDRIRQRVNEAVGVEAPQGRNSW